MRHGVGLTKCKDINILQVYCSLDVMYRKIHSLVLFMSELEASCIDEQQHRDALRINL